VNHGAHTNNRTEQLSAAARVEGVQPRVTTGENNMKINGKSTLLGLAAVLMLATVNLLASAQTHREQATISGVVTASQIASYGSGVATWEKKLNCHGEADCAKRLVGAGGKYVLVTNKGVYALSDQSKAAQFVAMRVTVSGTLDTPKKTIEVAEVAPYNSGAASAAAQ
jgi:hypothetical protein